MLHIVLVSKTLLGAGMRAVLEQTSDYEVLVPETCELEEVATLIQQGRPDVSILDATSLNVLPWFEILGQHRMAHLGPTIVINAAPPDEETFFMLMKWGCFAYLKATVSSEELITTVQKVVQGECLLTSDILADPLLSSSRSEVPPPVLDPANPLTLREVEVLYLLGRGKTNKEIAKQLRISDQTIKNHLTRIYKKLNVQDRTEAVVCALRRQWVLLPGFPVPTQQAPTTAVA